MTVARKGGKGIIMCCCGKPTINGQLGYKWQPNEAASVRPVSPPSLADGDVLLYDEPGRCGGIDSHSHHYRVVKDYGALYLLVRHGGGDDRINLHLYKDQPEVLAQLTSNGRYWLLNATYHAYRDGKSEGHERTEATWRRAAAEKRIKTRKVRGGNAVKVWIES